MTVRNGPAWLTPNVRVLSLVSLLQDAASELLYPLLPIYLTTVLGAPPSVVGRWKAPRTGDTDRGFTAFAGHRLDVRQANCSVSSASVLRGLHFAQLPPSQDRPSWAGSVSSTWTRRPLDSVTNSVWAE